MDELKNELINAIKDYINTEIESKCGMLEKELASLKSVNQALSNEVSALNQRSQTVPTPGKDGDNGKDGRDGKDGKDGQDGKSVDLHEIKGLLELMFEPYKTKLETLRDGKDGKDGRDVDVKEVKSLLTLMFEPYKIKLETLKDGRDGKDGIDGKDGKDGQSAYQIAKQYGYNGTELEFAQAQFGKDGVNGRDGKDGANGKDGLDGKDGLGFDDLNVEFDGERTITLNFESGHHCKSFEFAIPAQIYRGVFKKGATYAIGDTVTDNGSLWTCINPTTERPLSSEDWQLTVKHGRQGEKGKPGLSAYEVAKNSGFAGSEKEFIAEIRRGLRA